MSTVLAAAAAGAAVAALAVLWPARIAPPLPPGTVYLTFDVEVEPDRDDLAALAVDVPASYFFTGQYAEMHPELVRALRAQGDTIGAHSFYHDDLATLPDRQLLLDLRLNRAVVERIACVPVRWFRAPYLSISDLVLETIAEAGYAFNSSAGEPEMIALGPPSLPIAVEDGLLMSDYDIFEDRKLDDARALDALIGGYESHRARGLSFVVLLHPHIIARHAPVLAGFIAHVRSRDGHFARVDDFVADLERRPARHERRALWIDLGASDEDPAAMAARADALGATDAYLTAVGPDGTSHLAPEGDGPSRFDAARAALRARGLRVHAWLSLGRDARLVAERPELAMVDTEGVASASWLSASLPEVRQRAVDLAAELVRDHDVDGLMLADLGYPDWNLDASPAAIARFRAATGLEVAEPRELLEDHYWDWMLFRWQETGDFAAEVAGAVRAAAPPGLELGAVLASAAALDIGASEADGERFDRFAGLFDTVALTPLAPEAPATDESIYVATRVRVAAATVIGSVAPAVIEGGDADAVAAEVRRADRLFDGVAVPLGAPPAAGAPDPLAAVAEAWREPWWPFASPGPRVDGWEPPAPLPGCDAAP